MTNIDIQPCYKFTNPVRSNSGARTNGVITPISSVFQSDEARDDEKDAESG